MRTPATFLLLTLTLCCGVSVANDQGYSGPTCLGPFCITKNVSTRSLWSQLGTPVPRPSESSLYCFEAAKDKSFLWVVARHDDSGLVAETLLSDFPNCLHLRENFSQAALRTWKTKEGIGIGNSDADVLRTYGKPSSVQDLGVHSQHVFVKGALPSDKLQPMGDKALFYHNERTDEDLSAAEFGIRDGKVSYIWLSYNE